MVLAKRSDGAATPLPNLLDTHRPLPALLRVGFIWAAWHLPLLLRN